MPSLNYFLMWGQYLFLIVPAIVVVVGFWLIGFGDPE